MFFSKGGVGAININIFCYQYFFQVANLVHYLNGNFLCAFLLTREVSVPVL